MKIFYQQKATILSLLVLLVFTAPSICWGWEGKVVGVSDGDTISVMHDGKAEKIRIYGIDCPESHQDFGQKAKQFTSSMVFGKIVEVKRMDTDRYGRTVGLVSLDGKSLNEELVQAGMAWVYTKHCRESFCQRWYRLEESARNGKIGLWWMSSPTPPWEYRHRANPNRADQ